jgi:hypothetical protein
MRDLSTASGTQEDHVNIDTKARWKIAFIQHLGPLSIIQTPIFGAAVISGLVSKEGCDIDFKLLVLCSSKFLKQHINHFYVCQLMLSIWLLQVSRVYEQESDFAL